LIINHLENLEQKNILPDNDPTASSRKRDHIALTFKSQVTQTDTRFYYEPLFAAHPEEGSLKPFLFLNKTFKVPLWVSSMTGGTELARIINRNLARACGAYGFGMGLGSCRQLLHSDEYFEDFNVRPLMGFDVPLFANLGIAQLELLIERKELYLIDKMVDKLQADGLIIHVNPMQEWLQPEGDRFKYPPIETIETVLNHAKYPIIVKEVGQGFGYHSLKTLFQMPLAAVDFAAAGGTSFSKLELLRGSDARAEAYGGTVNLGHTAVEMVDFTNQIIAELGDKIQCKQVIISGGIKDFLDGFYLTKKLNTPSIYGQASGFLKHAQGEYADLENYIESQIRGLELAEAYLKVR
jgi:isopentenyl-diphosphate Delta-isomerase